MSATTGAFDEVVQTLVTIKDYLRWGASQFIGANLFYGHGTDNPWDEAEHLVLAAIKLQPPLADEWLDARLSLHERQTIVEFIRRRIDERMPVPYITGVAYFNGLPYAVDERVLIPRSPIGELIEREFAPWLVEPPQRILDLCTGSGCIGIACAHVFDEAEVQLSDISFDAITVAEENIARHGVADRVFSIQSDLFDNLLGQRFDLIVSNPPYVDADDMASLPDEYRVEPELALASGDDGLDFTRRLLREASSHLTDHGVLVVEVGNSWPALEAAFPNIPFTWIEFERGGHGVFALTADVLRDAERLGHI